MISIDRIKRERMGVARLTRIVKQRMPYWSDNVCMAEAIDLILDAGLKVTRRQIQRCLQKEIARIEYQSASSLLNFYYEKARR